MGLQLFDNDSSDDSEDASKIEINEEFARRYEHNKKREDLQRLEELNAKGCVRNSSGSSSEEDDEDEDDVVDSKFFDALLKVKNQDPSLKLKDTKLFDSSDGSIHEEGDRKSKKEKKPMYLKDVTAKQLIEAGPEFEEDEEPEKSKSYAEEQEELKRAFLVAAEEGESGDDEGDFLKIKEKKDEDADVGGDADFEFQNKLDQYFGKDKELDEDSLFLRNYFSKKMWVSEGKNEEDLELLEEDEEELEKQEDYEREYNFRYEENAGDQVLGHARFVDGSVRKKPTARKLQRKRKKERMEQAEFERKEELKHLKNLKREEIIQKRNKIKEIAGIGGDAGFAFNADDLEDDFDPEEHDRKMKDVFGEKYYNAEDADPAFGSDGDEEGRDIEKPDFDKEDELLEIPKDWEVCPSSKEFLVERERLLKRRVDIESEKQEDKEGMREDKELGDEEMEEIYKLDYEDTIGDIKTRFKYAKVNRNRYGLKPEELLIMDDGELNQYVSLKKLAPYRESEWKVPNSKRYERKMKNKVLLKGGKLDRQQSGKKKRLKENNRTASMMGGMEEGNTQLMESNGDGGSTSKKSRKKHCQEDLKLPVSRLASYGKIPYKPKNKVKPKKKAKH